MSNTSKRDAPCKHCEERHTFCHTTCEKYEQWRKLNTLSKEEKAKRRGIDEAITFRISQMYKSRKRKH